MKKLAFGLLLGTISSTAAFAGPAANGMYADLFVGGVWPETINFTQAAVNPDEVNGTLSLNNGFDVSGAVGFDVGNGFSLEGQVGYLKANTDTLSLPDVPASGMADGDVSALYGMVNAWYSMDMGGITPFIGGGVGAANLTINSDYSDLTGSPAGTNYTNDSATAFAWQLGVGLQAAITDNVDIVGRYRYFNTADATFTDGDGTDITASLHAHIVEVGVRVGM
ncbi:MAG TPA: outer membrane beta-barrel protein [Devosiaceae bacterium]